MSSMDNDPAASVEVPAWVTAIEDVLSVRFRKAVDAVSPDTDRLDRLCREVRELLVIIADLKEQRGEVYHVRHHYRDFADYSDETLWIGHSCQETVIRVRHWAEEYASEEHGNYYRCLIEKWSDDKCVEKTEHYLSGWGKCPCCDENGMRPHPQGGFEECNNCYGYGICRKSKETS